MLELMEDKSVVEARQLLKEATLELEKVVEAAHLALGTTDRMEAWKQLQAFTPH